MLKVKLGENNTKEIIKEEKNENKPEPVKVTEPTTPVVNNPPKKTTQKKTVRKKTPKTPVKRKNNDMFDEKYVFLFAGAAAIGAAIFRMKLI